MTQEWGRSLNYDWDCDINIPLTSIHMKYHKPQAIWAPEIPDICLIGNHLFSLYKIVIEYWEVILRVSLKTSEIITYIVLLG